MAVEHINYSDTLRQGTDKINAAIDQSNEAITTANDAKSTADQALANSENTQTQLDTIVINGDSSVEAAQARVDANGHAYTTLKDRLDNIDAQLSEKVEQSEFDKTNQNVIEINKKVNDFNFTSLSPSFHTVLQLPDPKVMQCFVINEETNEIYATQVSSTYTDPSESFILSRLTMDGILIDSMTLIHGGHGVCIGIENADDGVYIWSIYDKVDAENTTIGHDLVRFKYVPNAVYDETAPQIERYETFNTDPVTPAIDQKNGTILFRVGTGSSQTVELRKLDDVKNGIDNVLASMTIPSDLTYLQGFSIDGYDLYWYTGDAVSIPREITRFDIKTGTIKNRVTVDFGKSPSGTYEDDYNEPEGIYLYTEPSTGAKSLFAGVVTGNQGRRINKVYGYHTLGNDSKFIGNKTQSMQSFALTQNNGNSKLLPSGLTKMSDLKTPGYYYMSSSDSSTLTDHPLPGVAGWFLENYPPNSGGDFYQVLRRNTVTPENMTIYFRHLAGSGNVSPWTLLYAGKIKWVDLPLASGVVVGPYTPQVALTQSGVAVSLRGSFQITVTYSSGMVIGNLPTGYIPSQSQRLSLAIDDGTGAHAFCLFSNDGSIKLYSPVTTGKNVFLDGQSFYL